MIISRFPDINWLRHKANNNFEDQTGLQGMRLNHQGWPNVVLNTSASGIERTSIKGTFSIFLNLQGESLVRSERREFVVRDHNYVVTNLGEYYDLHLPERQQTTTFNIHFGEHLFKNTVTSLKNTHQSSLDDPTFLTPYNTFVKSRIRGNALNQSIRELMLLYEKDHLPIEEEESQLVEILSQIMAENNHELKGMKSLTSLKKSTREELMRRLLLSCDYIHEHYMTGFTLEDVSHQCMLSKYHYLRIFREAFGVTPQEYKRKLQMVRAKQLLTTTDLPVREVAFQVGFKEPNAFIKSFGRLHGSPGQFRKQYQG